MTRIAELVERVKAATGPDRELDADLWVALVPGASRRNVMDKWPDEEPIWEFIDEQRNTSFRYGLLPDMTASIDAALALCERVLPDRFVTIKTKTGGKFHHCELEGEDYGRWSADNMPTVPLAILLALLLSLESAP